MGPGTGTVGYTPPASSNIIQSNGVFPSNYIVPANKVLEVTTTVPSSFSPTNLTFGPNDTLQLSMDSSTLAIGTLNVTGNVNLFDTNLIILDTATTPQAIPAGSIFSLVQYGGTVSGEFMVNGADIPEGGTFQVSGSIFQLNYAAGDPEIILTDLGTVPEPSAWVMLAGGFAFLVCWRRTRRALSDI